MTYKKDLNTNSGMQAVRDYEAYKDADAYDQWKSLFCKDSYIEKQVKNKIFIPSIFLRTDQYLFRG